MTATDELRRLLDERRVKYEGDKDVTRFFGHDGFEVVMQEDVDGKLDCLTPLYLTPAQAVEATLGRGTCHECAGMEDMFECSACGMRYEGWALKRWARYCPNCGRRIEVDA